MQRGVHGGVFALTPGQLLARRPLEKVRPKIALVPFSQRLLPAK